MYINSVGIHIRSSADYTRFYWIRDETIFKDRSMLHILSVCALPQASFKHHKKRHTYINYNNIYRIMCVRFRNDRYEYGSDLPCGICRSTKMRTKSHWNPTGDLNEVLIASRSFQCFHNRILLMAPIWHDAYLLLWVRTKWFEQYIINDVLDPLPIFNFFSNH